MSTLKWIYQVLKSCFLWSNVIVSTCLYTRTDGATSTTLITSVITIRLCLLPSSHFDGAKIGTPKVSLTLFLLFVAFCCLNVSNVYNHVDQKIHVLSKLLTVPSFLDCSMFNYPEMNKKYLVCCSSFRRHFFKKLGIFSPITWKGSSLLLRFFSQFTSCV